MVNAAALASFSWLAGWLAPHKPTGETEPQTGYLQYYLLPTLNLTMHACARACVHASVVVHAHMYVTSCMSHKFFTCDMVLVFAAALLAGSYFVLGSFLPHY